MSGLSALLSRIEAYDLLVERTTYESNRRFPNGIEALHNEPISYPESSGSFVSGKWQSHKSSTILSSFKIDYEW